MSILLLLAGRFVFGFCCPLPYFCRWGWECFRYRLRDFFLHWLVHILFLVFDFACSRCFLRILFSLVLLGVGILYLVRSILRSLCVFWWWVGSRALILFLGIVGLSCLRDLLLVLFGFVFGCCWSFFVFLLLVCCTGLQCIFLRHIFTCLNSA